MNNKLLFLAGSARKDSVHKKIARKAFELAKDKGADCTLIELNDFVMPLYNGDLEEESGLPENAKKLKQVFVEHKGVFIASPEYNSSISPLLKNSLDWISRKEHNDEPPLVAYQGKTAALSAAGPGHFGGIRGLVPLRMMLSNISVTVLPEQLAIPYYAKAFAEGELTDEAALTSLDKILDRLIVSLT